jgi:hypothetical protein
MKDIIYENESILVTTNDDNIEEEVAATSHAEALNESKSKTKNEDWLTDLIIPNIVFYVSLFFIIKVIRKIRKKKAQEAAFERKFAEKTAYDHYSTGGTNTGYSDNSYDSYSNQNGSEYGGYNNYSNQNNSSYNSGASSSQPTNPFADKFEGKTPDEARKIYLKYMKAFHSDTGDGSDDEDVKQINAAYDEYKKAHGIN